VREKLDTGANDSGKDEYDVRIELGSVSDIEAYELRAEYGCESFVEVYEFLGDSERASGEVFNFGRESIVVEHGLLLVARINLKSASTKW
jgi:hypothetical protein